MLSVKFKLLLLQSVEKETIVEKLVLMKRTLIEMNEWIYYNPSPDNYYEFNMHASVAVVVADLVYLDIDVNLHTNW
jgi:hypothetical protein